ncbi:cation diffusion facilitator family transporter [Niabella terrae]
MALKEQQQNFRTQVLVALVSVLLLLIKFLAYWWTGSVAVLTDAMESIVNVIAGLIGLYSLYIAARPRDENHPYGHGKAEFLSAAVEGVLMGLAGLFILYEATHKLIKPVPIQKIDLGLLLIAITAVVNYLLGSFCIRQGRNNRSMALEAGGRHLQTDTYSTLAILLGLALIYVTGLYWIDAVMALLVALFVIYQSYHIIRRSVAGIMDEADSRLLTGMVAFIDARRRSNWIDIHNLRVIKYGSILHLDAHLTVPWYFTTREAHREIDIFSGLIRQQYGQSLELFIHTDGCLEELQCRICIKNDCSRRKFPLERRIRWSLENVVTNEKHNSQTSSLNS